MPSNKSPVTDQNWSPTRSEVTRFEDKVWRIPFHPCWEWTGARDERGYGRFTVGSRHRNRGSFLAHRFSWLVAHGSLPKGIGVCHRCDNPSCVRPDHLFLGTQSDNMRDCALKGRTQRGETHSHASLTAETVAEIRGMVERGETQKSAMARFGLRSGQVSRIVSRVRWASLPDKWCPRCGAAAGSPECPCSEADRADFAAARDFLNANEPASQERASLVALLRRVRADGASAARAKALTEAAAILSRTRCREWSVTECALAVRTLDHPAECSCHRWVDCGMGAPAPLPSATSVEDAVSHLGYERPLS